jgi:hypothetical protein
VVAAVLVITACLVSVSFVVPPVDADIVPVDSASGGFILPSSQDIEMPFANVSIKAVITGSFTYDISVNSSFELSAQSTANCIIAFVYPEAWISPGGETAQIHQEVYLDDVKANYSIVAWDELSPALQVNLTENTFLEQCSYAVFNTTFAENQTRFVDIYTTLHILSNASRFVFSYAVGSGKYWTGQTNETVTMEIDDRAGLLSLSFTPEPSILKNVSTTVRVAAWSISVDQFEDFWVSFDARQFEYRHAPAPQGPWPVLVGMTALAAIIIVMTRLNKR